MRPEKACAAPTLARTRVTTTRRHCCAPDTPEHPPDEDHDPRGGRYQTLLVELEVVCRAVHSEERRAEARRESCQEGDEDDATSVIQRVHCGAGQRRLEEVRAGLRGRTTDE